MMPASHKRHSDVEGFTFKLAKGVLQPVETMLLCWSMNFKILTIYFLSLSIMPTTDRPQDKLAVGSKPADYWAPKLLTLGPNKQNFFSCFLVGLLQ